jgi:hypothetical protein
MMRLGSWTQSTILGLADHDNERGFFPGGKGSYSKVISRKWVSGQESHD